MKRTIQEVLKMRWVESSVIVALFFGFATFALRGVLESQGSIAQQDWVVPTTGDQARKLLSDRFFAWSAWANPLGSGGTTFFDLPYRVISAMLSSLGYFGGTEIKLLSLTIIASAGVFAYFLGRSFSLPPVSSLISGLSYMSTALAFDWLMFGWTFNLISYAILPLFILFTTKLVRKPRVVIAVSDGVLLAMALTYPQSLVVYGIVAVLILAFEARKGIRQIAVSTLGVAASFGLAASSTAYFFTSYSGLALKEFPQRIDAINSNVNALNVFRLWGSTFNAQFENYFPANIAWLSFLFPIVIGASILIAPRLKTTLLLGTLALVAPGAVILESLILRVIPYSIAFRSLSLFYMTGAVASALCLGFVSNKLLQFVRIHSRQLRLGKLAYVCVLVALLAMTLIVGVPWWSGASSGNVSGDAATKLNLYSPPNEYSKVQQILASDTDLFNVLYLPTGGTNLQLLNSTIFGGTYQGIGDPARTETSPGGLIWNYPSYQPSVGIQQYVTALMLHNATFNPGPILGMMNYKYVVVRLNSEEAGQLSADYLKALSNKDGLVTVLQNSNYVVFRDEYFQSRVVAFSTAPVFSNDFDIIRNTTGLGAPLPLFFLAQDIPYFLSSNALNSGMINFAGNFSVSQLVPMLASQGKLVNARDLTSTLDATSGWAPCDLSWPSDLGLLSEPSSCARTLAPSDLVIPLGLTPGQPYDVFMNALRGPVQSFLRIVYPNSTVAEVELSPQRAIGFGWTKAGGFVSSNKNEQIAFESETSGSISQVLILPRNETARITQEAGPLLASHKEDRFTGGQATPLVHMVSFSPTDYALTISSTAPFFLLLCQSYDNGWHAIVNGEPLTATDHIRAEGFANAWYITNTGNLDVRLHFVPQESHTIGLLVSIGSLVIAGVYLVAQFALFVFKKKGTRPKFWGVKAESLPKLILSSLWLF